MLGLASSRSRVWHPAVQHLLWQSYWAHPGDVADPSHFAVVRHRLEVRDAESVEKFGGALAVPHSLEVEGPDERVEGITDGCSTVVLMCFTCPAMTVGPLY